MTSTTPDRAPSSGRSAPPASRHAYLAVLRQSVLDRWAVPAVVGTLMVAMGLLTGALWPALEETLRDLPRGLSDNLGKALAGADLTSGVGWANAQFITVVAPLGLIAVATMAAVRGLPAEEESKTMGTVLAAPVRRSVFLAAKLTAVLLHVAVTACLVAVGLVLAEVVGDLGLSADGIIGASLHVFSLAAFFGAVGVAVGAATGDRRRTVAVTVGLAAAAFVLSIVLPLVDMLDELARLSPWYYFSAGRPLTEGPDWGHLAVLAALTVALAVVAVRCFDRRDLRG